MRMVQYREPENTDASRGPAGAARRGWGDEQGQTLVLLALTLVGLVFVVGLSLDGAQLFSARRDMQVAADAGALAGASELDRGSSQVTIYDSIARYAIEGNGADGFTATYLPDGQPLTRTAGSPPDGANGVCVTAGKDVPPYFMGGLGFGDTHMQAHACAIQTRSNCMGGCTIWADGTYGLSGIDVTGSGASVVGLVHSNADLKISGSGHRFEGTVEYVTTLQDSGSGHVFIPDDNNPALVDTATMPVEYNIADYRPGGAAALAAGANYHHVLGDLKVSGSNETLSGLYYVTGDAKVSGSGVHGTFTIVAEGDIDFSGSGHTLYPFSDGLLFFSRSTGKNGISVTGSGADWRGVIYAPQAEIKVSGSGHTTMRGSVFGRRADVSGSGFTMNYDPVYCPASAGARVRLSH